MLIALAHGSFCAGAKFVEHLLKPRRAKAGMESGVQRARLEMGVRNIRDRPDLFQIAVREDRLAHFEALGAGDSSRSNRLGRGPMIETKLMTSSSRIGSIGGLVTCAKFCLK